MNLGSANIIIAVQNELDAVGAIWTDENTVEQVFMSLPAETREIVLERTAWRCTSCFRTGDVASAIFVEIEGSDEPGDLECPFCGNTTLKLKGSIDAEVQG